MGDSHLIEKPQDDQLNVMILDAETEMIGDLMIEVIGLADMIEETEVIGVKNVTVMIVEIEGIEGTEDTHPDLVEIEDMIHREDRMVTQGTNIMHLPQGL